MAVYYIAIIGATCSWTFNIWLAVEAEGRGAAGTSPEDNIFPLPFSKFNPSCNNILLILEGY
jgi:hypothetical protein